MGLFGKKDDKQAAATVSPAKPGALSDESTVAEWLEHPVGGAIFRDMLKQAGQDESVLRLVRRFSLKKLGAMSKGKFTQEVMDDMVMRANSGEVPAVDPSAVDVEAAKPPTESSATPAPADVELPEWQEKITEGRFADKTVIVTGAGSGIGRATASRVAREGGRVIAVDMFDDRLQEFKAELPDADITTVAGDITDDASIQNIISAAGERIDALANVAGIMDKMQPIGEADDAMWERLMNINVLGMVKLTRAALPLMLPTRSATIVNITSEAGLRGSSAGVAYTASKHAVIGITKSTAFMYGPSGIRANAVAPGGTMTNIDGSSASELGSARLATQYAGMPEMASPQQLAASITFLLSDDSTNVNGAILPSDGGWSAQ